MKKNPRIEKLKRELAAARHDNDILRRKIERQQPTIDALEAFAELIASKVEVYQ
jgi:hypothetical protein